MQKKPRFLLAERGRYFHQRNVPQHLQTVLGRKKWRGPLGADIDEACDRLKDLRREHDALIAKLEDPDARQDAKTEPPRFCRRLLSLYFKLRFCLISRFVRIVLPLRLA